METIFVPNLYFMILLCHHVMKQGVVQVFLYCTLMVVNARNYKILAAKVTVTTARTGSPMCVVAALL